MATTNIKLNIKPIGKGGAVTAPYVFSTVLAENDILRIPYRYPFADIANYANLKTIGYFRHATTDVDASLGGVKTAGSNTNLGFLLPQTEKLILLVKRTGVASTGTPKQTFTIKGSVEYSIPNTVVEFPAEETFTSGIKIQEVDLYDYGLLINKDDVHIVVKDEELEFALIARLG